VPRDLFNDVVDPQIRVGGQKWYTVPLSIVVHTAIIAAIIIIPLMATDMMPEVPQMMAFVASARQAGRPGEPERRTDRGSEGDSQGVGY
jgi:hypothetical protein